MRVKNEPVPQSTLVDDEAQEAQSGSDTEGSLKDFIVPDSDVEVEVRATKSVSLFDHLVWYFQSLSRTTLSHRHPVLVQGHSGEDSDGLSEHERYVLTI